LTPTFWDWPGEREIAPGGVHAVTTLATEQVKVMSVPKPDPADRLTKKVAVCPFVWMVRFGSKPPSGVTVICAKTKPAFAARSPRAAAKPLTDRFCIDTLPLHLRV
jgi:hypothetical protein